MSESIGSSTYGDSSTGAATSATDGNVSDSDSASMGGESPNTAATREAFGHVGIGDDDSRSKISTSLFQDQELIHDEEDEDSNNETFEPAGSSPRARVNVKKSQLDRFFHVMNPASVYINSDSYCWVSLKVPCAYKDGMELKVDKDGNYATLSLDIPDIALRPGNLLGNKNMNPSNVFYQTIEKEILSTKPRADAKSKFSLRFKLPFKAETRTSDELFGEGTGQSAGNVPAIPRNQSQCHSSDTTCNAVFVFKKHGNNFDVATGVSTKLADNRDLFRHLGGQGARNQQASAAGQPSTASFAAAATGVGGYGSTQDLRTTAMPDHADEETKKVPARKSKRPRGAAGDAGNDS